MNYTLAQAYLEQANADFESYTLLKLERLTPALSTGPNVEYPWELPDGQFLVPCTHDFKNILVDLESSKGRNVLKLLEQALKNRRWQIAFGM